MRAAALLALFAVLAACSSQPTTPQAGPAQVATVPAPAAPKSAAGGPATESVPAPVESTAATKPAGKIPSGYRRVTRNGKELYCRAVVTLGSRFAEQMCFTREQLEDIATRTESTMNEIDRSTAVCAGAGQCGGG